MEADSSVLAEYTDPPKGTVKTIVDEYGQVIDFVEFHQQPAFQNPSLKNLQTEPPSPPFPTFPLTKVDAATPMYYEQPWSKEAPPGTIPILRRSNKQIEASTGLLNKGPAPIDLVGTTPSTPPDEPRG